MRFQVSSLREPIVLAPMAGGPSTPGLAAAVSNAGGLGFLAAGYLTPEQVGADLAGLRRLTDRPFGVNLFVPSPASSAGSELEAYAGRLAAEAQKQGWPLGKARWEDDGWQRKRELMGERQVPVVSFTFGCPDPRVIDALQATGCSVWVTVTNLEEAESAAGAGSDALVVQGVEAGGHRGSHRDEDGSAEIGVLALLRLIGRRVDLPLIAAGGIADGRAIAAGLVAGATAAALGTAFLLTPEAGTSAPHRAALRQDGRTALTRAFTGRLARGIENRFQAEHLGAPSAYPEIHHLTAPLRARARQQGDANLINLWAGQAYPLARELPAAELMAELSHGWRAALREAASRFQP